VTVNVRMTVTTAVACLLAAVDLLPLFDDSLWFVIAIGAVIVVAAAGTLTRLRPLPSEACLAIGVVALLLYLNLIFEVRHSWALVIPTPGSLSRLWDLIGTGIHDANRYAPPAPHRPGLLLLAAGGVGLTAVFADWIAVRLRSAALAGLWLLVLFTVPVMMNAPHDQFTTVLGFCLGGAGYLAMLSADGRERIRVWGRLISLWRPASRYGGFQRALNDGSGLDGTGLDEAGFDEPGSHGGRRFKVQGPDTRALAAAGRRVGLASIVLALAVPLIVPGLHPSKLFSSGPGIGGSGGGSGGDALGLPSALSQAVSQLHENRPRAIFTYRTSATASQQAGDAEYFRQYVFDSLGSNGWQVDDYTAHSVALKDLPAPPGLAGTTAFQTLTTTVVASTDFPAPGSQPVFLPLPYPPVNVTAPGNPGKWKVDPDRMVYSTSEAVAGRPYSVVSTLVDPSRGQLSTVPPVPKTAALAPDLRLPSSYRTAALKKLADTEVAGQTTEFGKVNALATWLSGPQFLYSLNAPNLTSAAGLINFLTKVKSGFCVQYAYAMTALTRLLGIPARFVVGYTGGTRLADGSYQVRNIDAHAWTEVYFPTLGWVRFEPTPAGQGTANAPNYMTGGTGPGLGGGANPVLSQTAAPGGSQVAPSNLPGGIRQETGPEGTGASPHGRSDTPWAAIALAVIAALVLAFALVAIVAPPIVRLAGQPDGIRRRRPHAATAVVGIIAAAALVALALYRLMARTTGLDLSVGWATVGIAFGATAAVALIVPAVFRLVLRRWRWMRAADDIGRAHAAWREFHDDLADFGVSSRPSEPPRSLAARVTATLPSPAAEAVARLALAEERASYAPHPAESEQLRRDGTAARRGLSSTARRSTRWRAAVFPASMMTAIAEAAARMPDRGSALRFLRRRG
jgi:transglutaminase-like putative cysteine protease